jgi:dTDP-4-amino-4,6-dideoxygalactose transaminase
VICQTTTFSESMSPILYQGAIPVFIDSENEIWNLCRKKLEEAISNRMSNGKKTKPLLFFIYMEYRIKLKLFDS